jgi:hypothetical protein
VHQNVHPLIAARQELGKNVTTAMSTHATEELLDTSLSTVWVTSRKESD